jgi:internalin A
MNGERSQSTAYKILLAVATLAISFGCDQSTPTAADKTPVAKAAPATAAIDVPEVLSADELRRRLGTDERARFRRVGTDIVEVHLAGAGVQAIEALKGLPLRVLDLGFCKNIKDISVLAGMPLKTLILEGTSVADLSPLAGMSLETLHLQDTPVTDLSVLEGMPLKQLNLKGVAVSDVTLFSKMPLSTLWLLETGVSDIGPLSTLTLESLDLQDTMVSDLSALAHMTTLRRLNIAGTEVSDIRPVTGLRLDRIFLSPGEITQGMDELRNIPSLGKIGTSHEHQFPASDFWERYDVGAWGSEKATPTEESAAKPTDDLPEIIPATDTAAPE